MKQTTCVCVAILAFGVGTGCIASKQTYVSRGNKLYDAGKYADAALNYRKAIQKDSKFGEAYYRLGLAAIKQDQAREAYDSLYRATQLLPNRVDVTEKFADVCLSYYLADSRHPRFLYQLLTQLSDELLAKNANSFQGLMLKGYLNSSDRKSKEAIAFFRKALAIDSSNQGMQAELVHLLIEDGQIQAAEGFAKELIARDKTYGPVYDALFEFYSTSGRTSDAENILETKVRNNPKNADYVLQLARFYNGVHKTAEMNASVERMVADPKDFPLGKLWAGDFYLRLQKYPEALRYYQDGAASTPEEKDRQTFRKRIVITLLALGRRDEALRVAEEVVRRSPEDDDALHLHADILLDNGKAADADIAIREYQKLLTKSPGDSALHFQLGRADRVKGDLDGASREFQSALNRHPNLMGPRYELAEIALARLRPEQALQETRVILGLQPNDFRGRLLRARALIGVGDWKSAQVELGQLLRDSPRNTDVQIQLGTLALLERKDSQARDIFNKVGAGVDTRAVAGLASTYIYTREIGKATELLHEGLKKWPNSTELLDQLGTTETIAGHYDLALTQFRQLLARDPKSVPLLERIGEVYELKGDHQNALIVYRQALELSPNDSNVAQLLADGLARAGNAPEAIRHYEGILHLHPDDASVMNNLAFLLADTGGDLDRALEMARGALAKAPEQAAYSDTVGYIYLKKGLKDSAKQTFGSLVRKYPHLAAFRYHLGLALYEKGDKAAAKKELGMALQEQPSSQDKVKIQDLLAKIG